MSPQDAPMVTGPVLETMNASNYTYVRVKTDQGDVWAASGEFKVAVGDRVTLALEMPMENFHSETLKRDFPQVELAAVCLCSGNRRGMFQPHVPGVEWGVGAMGNARWKGVRLRDVLNKVGVKPGAMEVAFNGADRGPFPETPDFVKSIPIEKALDENTLIAFEMNGRPLPHLNGFPARLVVAGWTGTYWMKQLTDIDVRTQPQGGFWMNPARP